MYNNNVTNAIYGNIDWTKFQERQLGRSFDFVETACKLQDNRDFRGLAHHIAKMNIDMMRNWKETIYPQTARAKAVWYLGGTPFYLAAYSIAERLLRK